MSRTSIMLYSAALLLSFAGQPMAHGEKAASRRVSLATVEGIIDAVETVPGEGGGEALAVRIRIEEPEPRELQILLGPETALQEIGFVVEEDREFFQLFTTVKGIGMRKALRAMAKPAAEVAAAIQAKDAKILSTLPEIGKRTAERIIAELHDKVDRFAGQAAAVAAGQEEVSEAGQEAISVLVQLGEKRVDAAALVERVLAVAPETESPEEIIQHVYKLKAGGK